MKTLDSNTLSTHKTTDTIQCNFCQTPLNDDSLNQIARIPSNVRSLKGKDYFVFKCTSCQSIHSLTPVDYDHIYEDYPIRKQKLDFFSRQLFKKRLRLLKNSGLKKEHTILDYGCGNGMFVCFLNELGYQAKGFDPYSQEHKDPSVLKKKYKWVLSQDVIEHLNNPNELLRTLQNFLEYDGTLVIGTPNAERIDLQNKLDQVGPLHQPYHRHIYSEKQLILALAEAQLKHTTVHLDWYVDTLFPFANSAFLYRLFLSGDGTIEHGFEPIQIIDFIKKPQLIFWGFFGFFFSRKTDMVVFAKKVEISQ